MQVRICVDKRGKGESEVFDSITHNRKAYVDLPVGDYHFVDDATDEIVMIVERKTHADLACSIKSRHMMEQLTRMNATKQEYPDVAVVLLFEGSIASDWIDRSTSGLPNTSLETFLTSLSLKGQINVQYTASIRHTASWCTRMAKRMEEGKFTLNASGNQRSPGAHISNLVSRADSRTKHNQWARLLCCVDGVSGEKALEIAKVFPTPFHLVMYCSDTSSIDAVKRISDIKIRSRRIGPSLAKKIVSMFSNPNRT